MSSTEGFFDKLERIDRRWMYLIVAVLVVYTMLNPIGLPIKMMDSTLGIYNHIEDNVQPGDYVLFFSNLESSKYPTLEAGGTAILRHLFLKDAKIVMASFDPEGGTITEWYIKGVNPEALGKEYGVDWVNLGYFAGGSMALVNFAGDIKSIAVTDFHGNNVADIPIMQDVNEITDFKYLQNINGLGPDCVGILVEGYGTKMGTVLTGTGFASENPYFSSGQYVGIVGDVRGGAEYELLTGYPGKAVAGMDAMSVIHLITWVFIILGNIGYFIKRSQTPAQLTGNLPGGNE